jgi:alkylation response protein AidB-like acyl-CoA dehydrogenase
MRFTPSEEQRQFASSLHDLLGTSALDAARAWGAGDPAPGLALWRKLAGLGVFELVLDNGEGGTADLVVAFEELGHHAMPGPLIETAVAPLLLGEAPQGIVSIAAPLALDADIADVVLVLDGGSVYSARAGARRESIDPARRLFEVTPVQRLAPASDGAYNLATLLCAAQLLGAGQALLELTVEHAKQRIQFGKPIGSFQAVKHRLAEVLIGLEFARPLLHAAAITHAPQDISAAKVRCGDAAQAAARAALQIHGAIAYTSEYRASLWLAKTTALASAWGTRAFHLDRVLAAL